MFKIIIAGDFVPCHRVATQIEAGDYSCLDEVSLIVQSADYAIVNFESPVVMRKAIPIDKTGPNLKCTAKAIECIAMAGFNCVTLANNHFRDYGQIGVEDTIETCIKNKVDYVGGGRDKYEAVQTLYRTIKGHTLAIVNVCENEWSIATDRYGGSAPLNPVQNYYAIIEAKQKADFVLAIVHGGIEGYQYPTPRMRETYRFFIDVGADAVINHHQHCYSGYEVYNGKPIFYGLGNFCFDKPNSNELWNCGYLTEIVFDKESISRNIYPFAQGTKEKSGLTFLDGVGKDVFFEKLSSINSVISDESLLINQFVQWLDLIGKGRLLNLEPIYNKYFRKLQSKGMLPKMIKGQARLDLYDRLSCESHRDVLRQLLLGEIEKF